MVIKGDFGTAENPNYDKLTSIIFSILGGYEEASKYPKDRIISDYPINFSYGVRRERFDKVYAKRNSIWRLNDDYIKQTKESKKVLGYTYIPSFRVFGEDAGKLEIFLLGPRSGTGFLRKGQKESKHPWDNITSNPAAKINDFEVLFPIGTASEKYFFPNLVSLWQSVSDNSQIYQDSLIVNIGVEIPEKLNSLVSSYDDKIYKTHEAVEREPIVYITRGYYPSGERFGLRSSINNPSKKYMQMFGLIRINSEDKNKRAFMGWANTFGVMPENLRSLKNDILKNIN